MNWRSDSDADYPEMDQGLQFHIRCRAGDVASTVLLPGDPARTDLMAAQWDKARLVASNREFRVFTGTTKSVELSACSTGIGGPSAACAVEELARIGARTFIRVGTCGTLKKDIRCGDLIVNSAAMRHDGTSDLYVEPAYPAAASYDVTSALIEACDILGYRCHVGVTCSTSSFYTGQARPGFNGYTTSRADRLIADLTTAGVLNFEMEAATIFTLASLFGLRSGSVCTVIANRVTKELVEEGLDCSIAVATEAARILARRDIRLAERNTHLWHGGLSS